MKALRFSGPVLAAATVILVGANAFPTVQRKHLLLREHRRLQEDLAAERLRAETLAAEIEALQHDPFVLERLYVETWKKAPDGTEPFDPEPSDDHQIID